jgi:PHD/YefM family antitoxin component YafN of YafNO toxin-antitoxin module
MVHAMMMVDAIKKNYTFVAISPPNSPSLAFVCATPYARMRDREEENEKKSKNDAGS